MKRIKIAAIFGMYLLFSCASEEPKSFTINGTIEGNAPEYLLLKYGEILDSSKVENNKFYFKGSVVGKYTTARFSIRPFAIMEDGPFYIENSDIQLGLKFERRKLDDRELNYIDINSITGTKADLMEKDLMQFEYDNAHKPDYSNLYEKKLLSYISQDSGHPLLLEFIGDKYVQGILDEQQKNSLFESLDTTYMSLEEFREINSLKIPKKILVNGSKMFDFELKNLNNELVSTKDFRGNWLYIDFWASWCGPCREENPNLIKLYNDYKDKGFEVLGVAMEKNYEDWENAVIKDELIWPNVIDTMNIQGLPSKKYQLIGIPTGILINPEGIIAQRNDLGSIEIIRKRLEIELDN